MYSVVSRDTFDVIQDIRRRIDDCRKGASIPMVLLGNKCDLAHMRKVTQEEGERDLSESSWKRDNSWEKKTLGGGIFPLRITVDFLCMIFHCVSEVCIQNIKMSFYLFYFKYLNMKDLQFNDACASPHSENT